MPHKRAIALQSLAESEFLLKLQEHTQGLFPSMKLVTERGVFPVQLMQSNRYASHRLALIGDAAHCCHPVGGQGLNLGIRDAAAIAQIIKKARERGEDIGSLSVLKRYENWRKPENLMILGFTDFLNRCFSNHLLPILLMRRFGIILLRNLPPLKIFALKLMTGSKGRNPQLV
jgi:2-octaprenyl-6-methoxyphenol hydroxylase